MAGKSRGGGSVWRLHELIDRMYHDQSDSKSYIGAMGLSSATTLCLASVCLLAILSKLRASECQTPRLSCMLKRNGKVGIRDHQLSLFDFFKARESADPPDAIRIDGRAPLARIPAENGSRSGGEGTLMEALFESQERTIDEMDTLARQLETEQKLSPQQAHDQILVPFPADRMKAWAISARISTPRNDDPEIILPTLNRFHGIERLVNLLTWPLRGRCGLGLQTICESQHPRPQHRARIRQTVNSGKSASADITNTKNVCRLAAVCSSFASTAFQSFLPD